jgi:ATP-dependent exoDNAse (exonuclease V) alpha subunit
MKAERAVGARRHDWSPQQEAALDAIHHWLNKGSHRVFRVFGFAGTGKTELAAEVGRWVPHAVFAAFTGKAVNVLKQRGCEPVSTLHRLLYVSTYDHEAGIYHHTPRAPNRRISLVVIDESSMVNNELGADVLRLGRRVLVLADPFQLPPIQGEGFFMRPKPDAWLSEIHRQARGNPIITFADRIRRGKYLMGLRPRDSIGETVRVVEVHAFPAEFDTVLCGRNKTRHEINEEVRRDRGFSGRVPKRGETVVCLRNDITVAGDPVFNGSTWTVTGRQRLEDDVVELALRAQQDRDSTTIVRVPLACFGRDPPAFRNGSDLQDFAFGYALTVHKSQGSEWPTVLLIDEHYCFPGLGMRWLYTGVTRARESITIVTER